MKIDQSLTQIQRRIVLDLARQSIRIYLTERREFQPPYYNFLQSPAAAFVTLRIQNELRGCIGSIEATQTLGRTIVYNALGAAFQDPRFPPLTLAELPRVEIEISILSTFRRIENIEEIKIGLHGIYLTFGQYRGLLLPQVAVEQQWDADTFLQYTCRKAGLPIDAWQNPDVNIHVFSAEIFSESELD